MIETVLLLIGGLVVLPLAAYWTAKAGRFGWLMGQRRFEQWKLREERQPNREGE